MSRSPVSRGIVEKLILPALRDLSTGDRYLLGKLLGRLPEAEHEMSLADALSVLFGGVDESSQALLRAFRKRVADQGHDSGFEIEVDSRKKSPATDRRVTLTVHHDWLLRSHLASLTGLVGKVDESRTVEASAIGRVGDLPPIRVVALYASSDSAAREFLTRLREEMFPLSKTFSYTPWTPEDLMLGDAPAEAIEAKLAEADVAIVCLAPAFLADAVWSARFDKLRKTKRHIVPVLISPLPDPIEDLVVFQSSGKGYGQIAAGKRAEFILEFFRRFDAEVEDRQAQAARQDPERRRKDLRTFAGQFDPKCVIDNNALDHDGLPDPDMVSGVTAREGCSAAALLDGWAKDPEGSPYCVVLGEYGIGKTTTLRMFAHRRLERSSTEPLPLTIYLDLRNALSLTQDGQRVLELEPILAELLRRSWRSTSPMLFDAQDVLRWVREEGAILIFDGLDEVLVHLTTNEGQTLIREMWRALPPDVSRETGSPGRLIFSCRSNYFPTVRAQASMFTSEKRELTAKLYRTLVMLPFNQAQIEDYLGRVLGETERLRAMETICSIHNLRELAERPFLLALIAEEVGRLERLRAVGRTVYAVDLYDGFVEEWLNRDHGKHTLKPLDKKRLTERLAAAMWAEGQREWTWERLSEWLREQVEAHPTLARKHLSTTRAEELLEEDFRTATFIRRPEENPNRFRFAHTSVQEYFLACHLVRELTGEYPAAAWAVERPSDETLVFVGELLTRPEFATAVKSLSRLLELSRAGVSENAFRYWLIARGRTLPEPAPTRVDLSGRDLFGLKIVGSAERPFPLVGANFTGANLRRSEWHRVDLTGAFFARTLGYGAVFIDARTEGADFEDFEGNGTVWRRSSAPSIKGLKWDQTTQHLPAEVGYACGHKLYVSICTISLDGRTALSGAYDNTLILWEIETGRSIRIFKGHKGSVTSVDFAPDGRTALSGSHDQTLVLWDLETGRSIRTFKGHKGSVTSVDFAPDGRTALSGAYDNTLILWEIETGRSIRTFNGHKGSVTSVDFASDGRTALSGADDTTLILWDIETGRSIRIFKGHKGSVTSVDFAPDGRTALSGSHDQTLVLWDLETGRSIRTFKGHKGSVTSVDFAPDGRTALSGSHDQTLVLWDLETGRNIRTFRGHTHFVSSVAFAPDGRTALSGAGDQTLVHWEIETGRNIRTFRGHTHFVSSVAFAPDGRTAFSGSHDQTLVLWDLETGRSIRTFKGHKGAVTSIAFAPEGKTVISGSHDRTLILWDIETGSSFRTFKGHRGAITSIAFAPDGQTIISGAGDNALILWEVGTGRIIRTFKGQKSAITSIAFAPDGRTIISGAGDNALILWEVGTGRIIRTFQGHSNGVNGVAFAPDGKTALSGSEDHTLILWDIETKRELHRFRGHGRPVTSCAFSPDGEWVLSGSEDGSIIWRSVRERAGFQAYHAPEGECATVDLVTKKFVYLEEDSWRRFHAVGPDPKTGRLRTYPPEAAYEPRVLNLGSSSG